MSKARAMQIAPSALDKVISLGAAVLLVMVVLAISRAAPTFPEALPVIWGHLATVIVALALTPVMLLRFGRGDGPHRLLGYVWCGAMLITALSSFLIREINNGGLSPIHILSVATLVSVVRIVMTARAHRMAEHRQNVRILAGLALLVAGAFTFPFGRMLGVWLFG